MAFSVTSSLLNSRGGRGGIQFLEIERYRNGKFSLTAKKTEVSQNMLNQIDPENNGFFFERVNGKKGVTKKTLDSNLKYRALMHLKTWINDQCSLLRFQ